MADGFSQSVQRDPALFYWILFPITIVMVLTGVLRHYASILLVTNPKPGTAAAQREQRYLLSGINFRNNHAQLSLHSFTIRKEHLVQAFKDGKYLKDPENRGKPAANPMTDPSAMEGMMGMMKGNMMMMIPQTLIMSWINAFFAGFVILKLPFPLTLRFKSMLQSGVATRDLDVRWVSSLSWYFLNLFGLQSIFIFILGNDNAASQVSAQMAQMNPSATFQPGQDPDKLFRSEAENLEVLEHWSVLDDVERRLIAGA